MMRKILFNIILLLPAVVMAKAPDIGKYPNIYKSGDYIITALRFGPVEDKTVLIKVEGIDNEFDGQIYKHTKNCLNSRCSSYRLETSELPGHKRWWTIQSSTSYGRYENLIFFPPGIDKKSDIFKTKRSKNFNAALFYKEYLGQKALRK